MFPYLGEVLRLPVHLRPNKFYKIPDSDYIQPLEKFPDVMKTLRTFRDRVRSILLFELIGLVLVSPLASWITGHGIGTTGLLVVVISLVAMAWNGLFNYVFDRTELACGGHLSTRRWRIRFLHAVLFELGLAMATVPIIAWWLTLGWWDAILLDIGFSAFYLLYTLIFNRIYDHIYPLPAR
jgi:uncharacterized membrane protein